MARNERNRWASAGIASVVLALVVILASCGGEDRFVSRGNTEFFTQDYNPPYLDVLWMVDQRSPLHLNQGKLVDEAATFFTRLDQATSQYRMAFVSQDMEYAKGRLQPVEEPVVLTKNFGTLEERKALVASMVGRRTNLSTSAINHGFSSAFTALQKYFVPRTGVPLVVVFLSDGDDRSPSLSSNTTEYYGNAFLALKQGNPDLLKIYSVNYYPLESGATPNETNRCATRYNADIDKAGFEDRYFKILDYVPGGKADLCAGFAANVDLTGLRLKDLPKTFALAGTPKPETILVEIYRDGSQQPAPPWKYDETANQISFDSAPPEGTTIQVTYFAK